MLYLVFLVLVVVFFTLVVIYFIAATHKPTKQYFMKHYLMKFCTDIPSEIKKKGFIFSYELTGEDEKKLEICKNKGYVESIGETGIKFFNEDYFYILKGNPHNVRVHTVKNGGGSTSFLISDLCEK
ncbi:MAG: hypothetical protein ACD_84C00045G0004 [uncultured bacterium]|nr:MAG: hypothetical protein ACD_84C00045G0004 [uncultured bacterium]